MALPLLVPPKPPSVGSSFTIAATPRIVPFGDGYEQRSESGLNPRRRKERWAWRILPADDADALVAFIEARAVSGFRYAFSNDAERQWRIDGTISVEEIRAGRKSVSVEVLEIFDP